MLATSRNFKAAAQAGLANENLQRALGLARTGFPLRRRLAVERLPEFEALREAGRAIKDHTLQHLDFYLEFYESQVVASGGKVHWAPTPAEACATVLQICRSAGAKIVTKGKSDRKSTRLNSSHSSISYAVFCLKKKTKEQQKAQHPS